MSATSITVSGWIGLVAPFTGPYQATAAFRFGLCAAYSQVLRPPRQNPVSAIAVALPLFFAAQASVASRSLYNSSSGFLLITSRTICWVSVIFERSAMRA